MGESISDPVMRFALEVATSKGWNQTQFARKLGHDSNQRLTNWKSRGMPRGEYPHVADILGLSVDELLGKRQRRHSTAADPHSTHVLCITQGQIDALPPETRQLVTQLIMALKGAVKGHDAESARPKPARKS